ncbi:LysR family transcriptional regulator [Streptomyces rapamycinicus]|uniref:LysR family transcriptional regulator n=2 Tax=Streptomyces rapamycinicus TaxID=1226757 RepID=A0A0A0N5A5_STRRN|nr:LysR family transcriptional regulator [Streptomyces rapamycinicus]AGP52006.1 LysR family transcriptional regulator [Streptomyces rapamycinicus NRRL 5491]MBB4779429.1 DNA-binding transcriptional LysR family regulator [Streptomyces rapamycinicus]RLV75908.1 LysR family transcriptional regulator [Streptomyces rapamycinicus NRRL 5491]UTP28201.1 LysR family transcriptional regulator [Streptomyces rapamycinicus NRRL 5491]
MDLDTVRTFVVAADAGQFQEAAAELAVTQQAVSKRIAALERELGVRLFTRTPRGAELTIDGQAFLPHARELLRVAERAVSSVRTGRRPLRVDVIASRGAASGLMRGFHRAYPEIDLDVVMLFDIETAVAAIRSGTIDASFRAVAMPGRPLPEDIESVRVLDEPLQLLTGPAHALAGARSVTVAQLAGHRIWMPGIVPGTEWAAYYDDLVAEFGLTVEATGPNFGSDVLLDTVADTPALATFMSEQTRLIWPVGHGLRRIPVTDPTPVYPHSLLWHRDNPHPALATLRAHLGTAAAGHDAAGTWAPGWVIPR